MPSAARYPMPPLVGYKDHDLRKNRLPAWSFGMRLHDKDHSVSPGPNAYSLPTTLMGRDKTVERVAAHSIHAKLYDKDYMVSPGPSAYSLQNFKPGQRAPAFSIAARLKDIGETVEC